MHPTGRSDRNVPEMKPGLYFEAMVMGSNLLYPLPISYPNATGQSRFLFHSCKFIYKIENI